MEQQFGPFTLLRKLAEGGMAVTWLARVTGDEAGRELVVKRILPRLSDDDELRALFVEEARIATGLRHDNIVETWDLGVVDGEYFLAMEYVWGDDLRHIATRGGKVGKPLPMRFAVHILECAARGLHHAHERVDERGRRIGLVHRDVSPPNIMVGFDGRVKVVDFGIARAESHFMRVRPGQLKGKFSYMSPEQVQGLEIDHRSDIFSLGILLYELTTQRRLFREESEIETIKAISEAQYEPPQRVRADYPPRLAEIVARALARDPDDRYDTAAAFADALAAWLRESRSDVEPAQLGGFVRDILSDRVAEIEAVTQAGYAGPSDAPVIPTGYGVPDDRQVDEETDAGGDNEPVVQVTHTILAREENDEFIQASRGSRPILWGVGAIVAAMLAFVLWRGFTGGFGTSYHDDYDAGIQPDEIDVVPLEAPEPPPRSARSITSEPDGAWIIVNSVATRQQTPAEVQLVDDAINTIMLVHDGFETAWISVDTREGDTVDTIALTPIVEPEGWEPEPIDPEAPEGTPEPPQTWSLPMGRIRVEAHSPGGPLADGEVLRNGELVASSLPAEFDVPAGEDQHVTVRAAGYRDAVAVVRARPFAAWNDARVVDLELPAESDARVRYTTVRLATVPRDATVTLDGEDLGILNLLTLTSPGHYVVEVQAEDHETWTRAYDATVGSIDVNALLEPVRSGPAQLSLSVEPEGVEIYGELQRHGSPGGTRLGVTALEALELEAGTWRFTLSREGDDGRPVRSRFELELAPQTHHTLVYSFEGDEATLVESSDAPLESP